MDSASSQGGGVMAGTRKRARSADRPAGIPVCERTAEARFPRRRSRRYSIGQKVCVDRSVAKKEASISIEHDKPGAA